MTWQHIWNDYLNIAPGLAQIAMRLACAMLIGIVIGLEREFTHRPAGLRTHILVALGACVASLMGEMLLKEYGTVSDPARISAQVITGVGFLGAGTIMKEGASVKGLTTAAGIWAVACLGIAAGFGYYALALLGMVFILITLTIFEALQRHLIHRHSAEDHYALTTCNVQAALEQINAAASDSKATIFDLEVRQQADTYRVTFRAWFVGRRNDRRRTAFFARLAQAENIEAISNTAAANV